MKLMGNDTKVRSGKWEDGIYRLEIILLEDERVIYGGKFVLLLTADPSISPFIHL
jgi:hypothetical protein